MMTLHYLLMDETARRIAVLTETFKCLARFEGRAATKGMVLSHVMGALDVREEDVGAYVYGAFFLLTRSHPVVTNTPGSVGAETTIEVSPTMAYWISHGPAEPDDREQDA